MVSDLLLNWIHLKIISAVVFHLIGLAKFQRCVSYRPKIRIQFCCTGFMNKKSMGNSQQFVHLH